MPPSPQPVDFPPVSLANRSGLLMVGGDLTPAWLLEAYRRGIFPWPLVERGRELLAWFSPDPRAVIELDHLHISKRLRRRLHSGQFQVTRDQDFAGVMSGCAGARKTGSETWITPSLAQAYQQLHALGYAHSVEVWNQESLVGGVYGVAIGGFFSGESMFHRQTDASKVALVQLVEHLRKRGYVLFDIQQWTPHTGRMGAVLIPRSRYLQRLRKALPLPVSFADTPSATC